MGIDSQQLPKEVLQSVLDYFVTGKESYNESLDKFSPFTNHKRSSRELAALVNWKTILSFSLVSKSFRELCMGRIFGTVFIFRCKKIGQLWRLLQVNPRLGSFTHTCYVMWELKLWPSRPENPSRTMIVAFGSRTHSTVEEIENLKQQAERRRRRGSLEEEIGGQDEGPFSDSDLLDLDEDLEKEIRYFKSDYATTGPDGEGIDENLKNASDLEEALACIFSSWTQLQRLIWRSVCLPIFTSSIRALAKNGTLRELKIDLISCDEDYLNGGQLSSSPTPPIELLGPSLERLTLLGLSTFPTPHYSPPLEELLRQERGLKAVIKLVNSSRNLEYLDPAYFGMLDDSVERLHKLDFDTSQFLTEAQVIEQTLPRLASIPTIPYFKSDAYWRKALHTLHPALRQIHYAKAFSSLEKQDVVDLGRRAKEDLKHDFNFVSDFLVDDGMAEEIVRVWNERYGEKLQK